MTKDEALRLALEALELVSIEFVCNGAHHAKKDRHEWLDPCPIVDRYKEAITAIKAALANEALEKKAENARELGLNYYVPCCTDQTCPKCKAALEAKDEPVAWMHVQGNHEEPSLRQLDDWEIQNGWKQYPLYTTPPQPVIDESAAKRIATALGWKPQRTWVRLTAEEREQVQAESYGKVPHHVALIAAVEAILKEKNT